MGLCVRGCSGGAPPSLRPPWASSARPVPPLASRLAASLRCCCRSGVRVGVWRFSLVSRFSLVFFGGSVCDLHNTFLWGFLAAFGVFVLPFFWGVYLIGFVGVSGCSTWNGYCVCAPFVVYLYCAWGVAGGFRWSVPLVAFHDFWRFSAWRFTIFCRIPKKVRCTSLPMLYCIGGKRGYCRRRSHRRRFKLT